MTTPEAIADQVLPLDSTDPGQVAAAANLLAELARRLCHAAQPVSADRSIPDPAAMDRIVADIATAVERLPQLCRHLGDRTHEFANDPRIAIDTRHASPGIAQTVALNARGRLAVAADPLARAAMMLDDAHQAASHLYLDDDAAPAEEPPLPPQPRLQGP